MLWVRRDRAGAQSEAKKVQKALGWAGLGKRPRLWGLR